MNPAPRPVYAFKPRAVPVAPSADDIDEAVARLDHNQDTRFAQLVGVLSYAVEYLAVETDARRRTETIRRALAHIAADARIHEAEQARLGVKPTPESLDDNGEPGEQS